MSLGLTGMASKARTADSEQKTIFARHGLLRNVQLRHGHAKLTIPPGGSVLPAHTLESETWNQKMQTLLVAAVAMLLPVLLAHVIAYILDSHGLRKYPWVRPVALQTADDDV
jgi:ABC-type Fe3+ transport system permease subunit